MRIIPLPDGDSVIAEEYEIKNTTTLDLPVSNCSERFEAFKLITVGSLVNERRVTEDEQLKPGDIVLVKVVDANQFNVSYNGQKINYIDGKFCIKILLEE
jgi:protein involved in polysaccharide export with SLBB domain